MAASARELIWLKLLSGYIFALAEGPSLLMCVVMRRPFAWRRARGGKQPGDTGDDLLLREALSPLPLLCRASYRSIL